MNRLFRQCCMLLMILGGHVYAGALTISPVSLQMGENQKAISMTIKNDAAAPARIQLRVFNWAQEKGNDVFRETNDIMISPPFVTLESNRSYNIRIFINENSPPIKELTYRIIIDEIPQVIDSRSAGDGIKISLRTSHPLFITPENVIANISWNMKHDDNGWYISARNDGIRHALLTDVYLTDLNSNKKIALKVNSVNGYILGHSYRDYDIHGESFAPMVGHRYEIEANINGKTITNTL